MGFTLNQLEQERQIRKLQKKEDKDTSNYEQLSNLPKINNVELKGDKTTGDLGINADNVMMSDGVTSVEDAVENMGNMRMTKLWENPNPSSSFPGQQIAISMDGYDLIFILFKNHTDSDNMLNVITLNGQGVLMLSAADVLFSRVFNTSTETFTNGFRGSTVDNTVCIPYQIYGINLT